MMRSVDAERRRDMARGGSSGRPVEVEAVLCRAEELDMDVVCRSLLRVVFDLKVEIVRQDWGGGEGGTTVEQHARAIRA